MPLLLTESGCDECLDVIPGGVGSRDPASQADDVHVVVLDALSGRVVVVDQAGADSADLIGDDRRTYSAPTNSDAPLHLTCRYGSSQRRDIVGIVVAWVHRCGAEIDNLVTCGGESCAQLFFQFKPAMIGSDPNAHVVPRSPAQMPANFCACDNGES